jgi:acyl carrier protein
MGPDEIRARIRQKIAGMASIPVARVGPEMNLTAQLGLDSLQLYELAAAIEDEFSLPELKEEQVADIETVGDVEARVMELLSVDSPE